MPTQELDAPEHLVTMVNRLREAREKLAAQVGSVESAKIRMQRQVIRQERLAAIGFSRQVSHIAEQQAILGSAELLQVRGAADARAELIMIQKESARASAIIRNLSLQPTAAWRVVRLREVVDSVLQLRKRRFTEAGIQIAVQETGEPVAMAVFEELQQVVLNLVINAEQAVMETSAPRRIDIKLARVDGKVRLEVHDSGRVPSENEAKLSSRFLRRRHRARARGSACRSATASSSPMEARSDSCPALLVAPSSISSFRLLTHLT